MTMARPALLVLLAFAAECDRTRVVGGSNPSVTAAQRIRMAEEGLSQAYAEFEAFPKLDVIVRVTRGFVIIRQVEMSSDDMDSKTQEELRNAKNRSVAVLARLSVFAPQLRKIESSLMDLRGSLHHLASQTDLTPEARSSIMRSRSRLGEAIGDLDQRFVFFARPSPLTRVPRITMIRISWAAFPMLNHHCAMFD